MLFCGQGGTFDCSNISHERMKFPNTRLQPPCPLLPFLLFIFHTQLEAGFWDFEEQPVLLAHLVLQPAVMKKRAHFNSHP